MFDFFLECLQKLKGDIDINDIMLLMGTNALDYKALIPYFIQYWIDKKEEKVLIVSFDDVLGPIINLNRNLGMKLDKLMKTGHLVYYDFTDFGVGELLQLEVPFTSKPSPLYVKPNTPEIESDENLPSNFLKALKEIVEKHDVKHVIISGMETALVSLSPDELKTTVFIFDQILAFLKNQKVNTLVGVNRECSTDNTQFFISRLISYAQNQFYLLENEGGFSKMITGQILLKTLNSEEAETNQKKIKYRLEDKSIEFFDKLLMI